MAKLTVDRRGWTQEAVLAYIGRSTTWWKENYAALKAAAFPQMDPILKNYDRDAVKAWWDRRSGLLNEVAPTVTPETSEEEELLERARSGKY